MNKTFHKHFPEIKWPLVELNPNKVFANLERSIHGKSQFTSHSISNRGNSLNEFVNLDYFHTVIAHQQEVYLAGLTPYASCIPEQDRIQCWSSNLSNYTNELI